MNGPQFVQQFNDRTKDQPGVTIPVEITVYGDRSFSFILKSPPAAVLLKQAAGIVVGSGEPHTNKVGRVTRDQVREIAQRKIQDLNTSDLEAAARIVAGTARSMGVEVVETVAEAAEPLPGAEGGEAAAEAEDVTPEPPAE